MYSYFESGRKSYNLTKWTIQHLCRLDLTDLSSRSSCLSDSSAEKKSQLSGQHLSIKPNLAAEHTYCESRQLSDLVKRELSCGPETFLSCSFYCTEPYFGYPLSPLPLLVLTLFSTLCSPLRHLQYRTICWNLCVKIHTHSSRNIFQSGNEWSMQMRS